MLNNDDLLHDLQDDSAAVATVRIILFEFADQDNNFYYLERDVIVEEVEHASLVSTELEEIRFKKWTKAGHLRPLYNRAHVNGKPTSRVLINGGAVLNMMPYSSDRNLRKSHKDLKETNMTMLNFTRESTPAIGFLITKLTVGSRTSNIVFFVVDGRPGRTILLGREWIHVNQCMPSTLHQQLQF